MADTSNILYDDLEQIHLRLMIVPKRCVSQRNIYFFFDTRASLFCSVDSKYFPESIIPFTYGHQNMTDIGGNVEIVGTGIIKWDFIEIKCHSKTLQGKVH